MSLDKQLDQTLLFFEDSKSEVNGDELEDAASMDLTALSLQLNSLNILEQSLRAGSRDAGSSALETKCLHVCDKREKKDVPIISLNEVSRHDTLNDCWLVICDYVYNCTDFIYKHPGSQDVMLEYAGRDATLAFVGTGHTDYAKRLLRGLLIGELPVNERIFRTQNGIKIVDYI